MKLADVKYKNLIFINKIGGYVCHNIRNNKSLQQRK